MSEAIKRVVVLGHTGFIGSRLVEHLKARHPRVETVGRARASFDLTDAAGTRALAGFVDGATAVVMCSAVKRQFGDSLDAYNSNMAMVVNLCRLLEQHPAARVVYFSSAAVYGEDIHNTAISEDSGVQPRSYYGAAKFASECLLRKLVEARSSMSLVCLRPPTVYGPGDSGETYGPAGFVRKALRGEQVTLWGDGTELREFMYIDDVVAVVDRMLFGSFAGVLNVASGTSYTFLQALEAVSKLAGRPLLAGSKPRSKRSVDNAFDNARITELMPDLKFVGLEEGVRRTYEAERGVLRAASVNER